MLPVEHTFLSTISQFGSKIINKIAASYDGKTKELYLKFGNFEIKNITIEQLNSLVHQRSEVADILKKIIVDRQIIWQSYDAEHIDECVRSLITLELYCTEKSKQLYSNSKNSFYADLLQVIGSEANETRREFERAIAADSILLKLNSKSRQKAAELLTPFRLKVIPIIDAFLDITMGSNEYSPMIVKASQKSEDAKLLLEAQCSKYKLTKPNRSRDFHKPYLMFRDLK